MDLPAKFQPDRSSNSQEISFLKIIKAHFYSYIFHDNIWEPAESENEGGESKEVTKILLQSRGPKTLKNLVFSESSFWIFPPFSDFTLKYIIRVFDMAQICSDPL